MSPSYLVSAMKDLLWPCQRALLSTTQKVWLDVWQTRAELLAVPCGMVRLLTVKITPCTFERWSFLFNKNTEQSHTNRKYRIAKMPLHLHILYTDNADRNILKTSLLNPVYRRWDTNQSFPHYSRSIPLASCLNSTHSWGLHYNRCTFKIKS